MATQYIKFKRSSVPGKRPSISQIELGELALNTYDGRIFTKKENVGIGTTVTLLNVWTENIGGGAYYNDGFVGIGTTNPTSKLHVSGDTLVTGVVTATAFNGNLNSTGVSTVGSLNIGATQVISSGRQLQNIASLDATTTATIESAIANAPNTFNDLNVTGVTTLTRASATSLVVSGVTTSTDGFVGNITGNLNSTGVNTATTLSGTSLTYTNGSFSNLNVSGVTTTGTLNVGVGGTIITTTSNGSVGIGTNTLLDTNNPGGLSILGKVLAGGSISSPNILNSVFPNTGTGHSAYRSLNLIDNSAAIKIVRTHNDFGPIVDLHQWNAGITTMISYWDIVAEQGTFSIRDRLGAYDNTKPQLSRLFINEYGNVLINASAQAIGPNKTQSVGYGTANVLQVNGNTFINGNLGIGTTNPQQQVQVGSAGTDSGLVISGFGSIGITTNNPTTFIDITQNTPTKNTVQFGSFGIQSFDNVNGFLSNNGYYDGTKWIYRRNGHSSLLQFLSGNIWLRTLPVGTAGSTANIDTRLAIQNNGNIGIGTDNPLVRFQVNENSSNVVAITSTGFVGIGTTNPTSKLQVQGDVLVSGVITSTDYNSTSDLKLKENIQVIENPIDKVSQINGVSFDWKETGKSSMGVIAQDVEKVLPELVNGTDSKTVNYNGLIGLLIEVVKEQQQRINSLEERFK